MIAPAESPLEPLTSIVESLKQAWRAGDFPDAEAALREHPDLLQYRSLVVDLVYEEYCVREEIGDAPEEEGFCHKFPAYRTHIRDVIRGHRLLADHPELLDAPVCWPQPGDSIDQLTIVRELGRGTFARVYLAHESETGGRPVVVKLASARSGEARTLGAITHDNIVTVLSARQAGGFFAVCMPFVGSVTLRDATESWFHGKRAARSFLEAVGGSDAEQLVPLGVPVLTGRESHPDAIAAISSRLADAVSYLHRRGIAHGDLKPSNIILGPGGRPYLIDFNLSSAQADTLLRRGGTLPYMPPEQLRFLLGEPESGTAMAGDVYSFGALLFESLTGRVPFEPGKGHDPAQLAADLLRRQSDCKASPTNRTGIPTALARVIDRCLDPNPATRPSMDSVKQAIDRYCNRHRGRRVSVGVAAAIAFGLAGWQLAPETRGVPAPLPAIETPLESKPQTTDEHFARGLRFLKADDVLPAMSDFSKSAQLAPSGRTSAYLAYTLSLKGYREAVKEYQLAIQLGFAPAWVHNNLARSLNETGLRENWVMAVTEASKALELDPKLLQARLNRADAQFRLYPNGTDSNTVTTEVLGDIEAVMSQKWDSAGLYCHAASITVRFGQGREDAHARAVSYLREAIQLGRKPKLLQFDPTFEPLKSRADFIELSSLPPGPERAVHTNPYLARPPLP